jgi:hypothetical protein
MADSNGFPLPGLFRQVAEGNLSFAEELLEAAERDVRDMLDGKQRSEYFKPETDAVTLLIENAKQVQLCQDVLMMDDEARERAEA